MSGVDWRDGTIYGGGDNDSLSNILRAYGGDGDEVLIDVSHVAYGDDGDDMIMFATLVEYYAFGYGAPEMTRSLA